MRLRPIALLGLATSVALGSALWHAGREAPAGSRSLPAAADGGGPYPSDWFGLQRAFPEQTIPQEKLAAALEHLGVERALHSLEPDRTSALVWSNAGPFNIGGRVTALAVVPGGTTIYLGAANGGVFKSSNAGVNWEPIFDDLAIYSIGAMTLEPGDPDVVYAGTGEANSSVDSYDGAGLFRTEDGGNTWNYVGLAETRRIARVAIDPRNKDRIFVAAMGTQFSPGPDRGLYLSENRGATWQNVLFLNDSTGVADVAIHPTSSDTVFASTWERIRRPSYRRAYGPGCGIWRSIDAGHTWTRLQAGLPAPSDSVGRIALAIAPSRPRTIYAQIIAGANGGYKGLGLYRSTNGGDTWTRRDLSTSFTNMFGGFGWYFGDLVADPIDAEKVYVLGVSLKRSPNGGANYNEITGNAHVDMHALWVDPADPLHIYLGCDGGFYSTTLGGTTWFKSVDLPITQFYAGTIDPQDANRILGGTQDNNTLLTAGSPNAWTAILGGDGFYCIVDPLDADIILAEWQNCCSRTGPRRSTDGGFGWATPSGFNSLDRYNWSTPFVMDPKNHDVVLVGSHRVYKSEDNGQTYTPVSGDLTTNPAASLTYGTISTLDISPMANLYYAGTDDAKVWRSTDGGYGWTDISAGLPQRWVTRVSADPFDSQVVYVTLSGFSRDETTPHVYRSADRGDTWTSIASNLPDMPANDILVDPADPYTLYLATDTGVWASRNRGASWFPLGTGMPVQTVFDLTLHHASRTLVASTHGRGQWRIDISSLPTDVAVRPASAMRLAVPRPNPSRSGVALALELVQAEDVDVAIYDAAGRRVRTLHGGSLAPGRHELRWDGRDTHGVRTSGGVYFVRAESAGTVRMQRLVRLD